MSPVPPVPTPFWSLLAPEDQQELQRMGTVRRFEAGSVIVDEGEYTDHTMVIRYGYVKVASHGSDGYIAVLALRDPGDLIGELAGVDGQPRSATLSALTDVEALVIPAIRFAAFRQSRPKVEASIHRLLTQRLREADGYRAATGADAVPRRLAMLLLDLGRRYGVTQPNGSVLIRLPLSQEDLAGLVLTSKRTIGRVLEQWRGQRLIMTGRLSLRLLDVPALTVIAAHEH